MHELPCAGYPEYDGGAPVTEFEVEVTNPDQTQRLAYRGTATETIVNELLPGQNYVMLVRASNRIGVSGRSRAVGPCGYILPYAHKTLFCLTCWKLNLPVCLSLYKLPACFLNSS